MPDVPPERTRTDREAIRQALSDVPRTARDLSAAVGLPERDVVSHLAHLVRSVRGPTKVVVEPPRCEECGFVYKKRDRLTRPSRCPLCKSERIAPPRFFAR